MTNETPEQQARRIAQMATDGGGSANAALDAYSIVTGQAAGKTLGERINAQRGQTPTPPKTEGKKP